MISLPYGPKVHAAHIHVQYFQISNQRVDLTIPLQDLAKELLDKQNTLSHGQVRYALYYWDFTELKTWMF